MRFSARLVSFVICLQDGANRSVCFWQATTCALICFTLVEHITALSMISNIARSYLYTSYIRKGCFCAQFGWHVGILSTATGREFLVWNHLLYKVVIEQNTSQSQHISSPLRIVVRYEEFLLESSFRRPNMKHIVIRLKTRSLQKLRFVFLIYMQPSKESLQRRRSLIKQQHH